MESRKVVDQLLINLWVKMSEKKFIEQLFTDSGLINEGEATKVLKNFVTINRTNYEIYFKGEAKNLTVEERIIVYGLAKKLIKLGGYVDSEEFSAEEIKSGSDIKSGSVDSAFKKLRDTGFLVGSGSKYIIPTYKAEDSIKKLKERIKIKTKNE